MANKNDLVRLKDNDGVYVCPVSKSDGIFMPDGNTTLTKKINDIDLSLDTRVNKKDIAINVKDFGAKGDGIADDSQAFQNAINYIFEKNIYGGNLIVPTGKYLLNTPFTTSKKNDFYYDIVSKITIIGDNSSSTIILCNSDYAIEQNLDEHSWYDLEIFNITFIGCNYNENSTPIHFNKSNGVPRNILISNCSCFNFGYGIKYDKWEGHTVDGSEQIRLMLYNVICNGNNIGFYVSGDDTTLEHCRSESNFNSGLVIASGARVAVNKCKIQYNCKKVTNLDDIHQIKIVYGVVSLSFNECYFEQKSRYLENNYNTTWIKVEKATYPLEKQTDIYSFTIQNCYINGFGCKTLIKDDGQGNNYKGIRIIGNRIRNFYLENKKLIDIPDTSYITSIYFDNSCEEIYDLTTKERIKENDIIVCSNKNLSSNNSRAHLNVNLSPKMGAQGGGIMNIMGSVAKNATQKFHGGEWYSVTKLDTGKYQVVLNFNNRSTQGGNRGVFPVIVTPISSTYAIASVSYLNDNTFYVWIRNQNNELIDEGFHFIASITTE